MTTATIHPPSACFVLVYFGDWPSWIDYFLKSCANSHICWLIFTTCSRQLETPSNVVIHCIDKNHLDSLVSRKLGRPFDFSYGYKLCDLKPAYGDIFSEYLVDFEYWGYTDLDLIWGDFSFFIDRSVLGHYDVITASDHLLVGHGTLVRNTKELAVLYRDGAGYPDKFFTKGYEKFDEEDFDQLVRELAAQGRLRLYNKNIQTDDCMLWWAGRSRFLILWTCGRLTDLFTFRPLCYFHFIQSKYKKRFRITPFSPEINRFYIDDLGIHPILTPADHGRFLLSFLITFAATIPWYFKALLKMVLPEKTRLRMRNLISR